jgi:hypothetical protein
VNNRYLACQDCKIYIDVGYRWAYWELEEPGIVARGDVVNVGSGSSGKQLLESASR